MTEPLIEFKTVLPFSNLKEAEQILGNFTRDFQKKGLADIEAAGRAIKPDVESAKKFYTQLFGWETEDMPTENMSYTITKIGDAGVGGIMPLPPESEGVPPHWGVYITVDDVDATASKAEELGGRIHVPPTDIPNVGRFCVIQDPQGSMISAITYTQDE